MTSQLTSVRRRRMGRAARRHGAVPKNLPQLEAMEVRRLLSTVIVNTLLDESIANATTSLREAIAIANAGDTVQFAVEGTVQLQGEELRIDKHLVIAGPGVEKLTIRGTESCRVFNISGPWATMMSGIAIVGGQADESGGGGIFNQGGLTLNACSIRDNTSIGLSEGEVGAGGGIRNVGGGMAEGNAVHLCRKHRDRLRFRGRAANRRRDSQRRRSDAQRLQFQR